MHSLIPLPSNTDVTHFQTIWLEGGRGGSWIMGHLKIPDKTGLSSPKEFQLNKKILKLFPLLKSQNVLENVAKSETCFASQFACNLIRFLFPQPCKFPLSHIVNWHKRRHTFKMMRRIWSSIRMMRMPLPNFNISPPSKLSPHCQLI